MITHQIEVVKAICDRAALIEKGRVTEEGSLQELLLNPRSQLRGALLHDQEEERAFFRRHGLDVMQQVSQKEFSYAR